MYRLVGAGIPLHDMDLVTPLDIIDLYKEYKSELLNRADVFRNAMWAKQEDWKRILKDGNR